MHKNRIGRATKMPLRMNGTKDPLKITLCAKSGIQPIGEVLRIIKAIEMSAVRITVFSVNLFPWSIKK